MSASHHTFASSVPRTPAAAHYANAQYRNVGRREGQT